MAELSTESGECNPAFCFFYVYWLAIFYNCGKISTDSCESKVKLHILVVRFSDLWLYGFYCSQQQVSACSTSTVWFFITDLLFCFDSPKNQQRNVSATSFCTLCSLRVLTFTFPSIWLLFYQQFAVSASSTCDLHIWFLSSLFVNIFELTQSLLEFCGTRCFLDSHVLVLQCKLFVRKMFATSAHFNHSTELKRVEHSAIQNKTPKNIASGSPNPAASSASRGRCEVDLCV